MGKRTHVDLECLGHGKWRCRNCDAVLSEGAELRHHRDYYCRHPLSESRAVDRERKCLGCSAALGQLRALRERAAARDERDGDARDGDGDGDAGGRAAVEARAPAALGRRAPACYVIHHDERADRLLRAHKLLDELAWLPWRRLEAVGGRDGGCALSHRAAWLRLRDAPAEECVLVLEDAVDALCDDFEARLQDLLAKLAREPSWRLCLLGGARERGGGSRLLARGARASLAPLAGRGLPPTGLVGYLLHRRALPRLLDAESPPDEPLEDALDARVDSGHGARFEVAPALVRAGPARHAAPATAAAVRGEADGLVASLKAGLVALGHWDAFPAAGGGAWRPVPRGLDLAQWARVLDTGMRPEGLAVLLVTGTLVPVRLHTALLHLIAARLPRSSVIALNVGELEADAAAYDALARAVAQPTCVLGHLYFRDPVSEAERARKRRVREQLRLNCAKPGYLAQLARDEVWALGGAHCWHNFSDALRARALAWAAAAAAAAPGARPHRPRIGHARQAKVGAWPHGAASTAPEATVGGSVERGDALVRLDEADVLRAQRVAFHAALLAAEPRQWLS